MSRSTDAQPTSCPIIREPQKAGATTLRQHEWGAHTWRGHGARQSRTRRQWSSYRALCVPRSAEWFVTRNAFAYLCREHVLPACPLGAYAGECRALPVMLQRQYLFVWLLCELLTLEDMLVIQHSSVASPRLPQSSWCTSCWGTGQIATIAFEAGLALVAHRARISLSSSS